MSVGLYLHVPFCRRICPYCDFYVVPAAERGATSDFVSTLARELVLAAEAGVVRGSITSIHWGGGTPSTLSADEIARVHQTIRSHLGVDSGVEIALEANPEDVSLDYAKSLLDVGVERLTLGIQSLDDDALARLGRKHRRAQALAALESARRAGFTNLGVDLMFGVPDQSPQAWDETVARVLEPKPEHVSAYELTFEGGTELDRQRARGSVRACDPDQLHALFMRTHDLLAAAGYEHYEVSNYARAARFRSRHNQNYWRHGRYLGVGPAAHSFDGRARWWNHRSLANWSADVEAGKLPVADRETLTSDQLRAEEILLGLRSCDGFALEPARLAGSDVRAHAIEPRLLDELVAGGYLIVDDSRVRPTLAGMCIADDLARRLTP